MVCSCAMSPNGVWLCVWLQITFCSYVNKTTLFSFLRPLLRENSSFPKMFTEKQTRWPNDKTIFLLNSVIAKDHDLSVVSGSIICLSAEANNWSRLTTDKSRYFAHHCRIIVNLFTESSNGGEKWIMYKLDKAAKSNIDWLGNTRDIIMHCTEWHSNF